MLLAALLTRIVAQPPVPSAVSVTTPAELQQAVRAGTAHILVTEHLDLSQIEEPDSDSALFTSDKSWKSTTLSVRVRPFAPAVLWLEQTQSSAARFREELRARAPACAGELHSAAADTAVP